MPPPQANELEDTEALGELFPRGELLAGRFLRRSTRWRGHMRLGGRSGRAARAFKVYPNYPGFENTRGDLLAGTPC